MFIGRYNTISFKVIMVNEDFFFLFPSRFSQSMGKNSFHISSLFNFVFISEEKDLSADCFLIIS